MTLTAYIQRSFEIDDITAEELRKECAEDFEADINDVVPEDIFNKAIGRGFFDVDAAANWKDVEEQIPQ